jgi:mono/diheme cytochrome c family protein
MSTAEYDHPNRLVVAFVAAVLAPSSCPAHAETAGRSLVQMNCARCHAIDRDDTSRHPEAPAFRDLHNRYPLDALEEAFVEGISVGHPDMPEFVASPLQIEAIIDYIETLAP